MTIHESSEMRRTKLQLDLNGSDGNAFVLLGHARNFARQLEIDFGPIRDEMMSGDYEDLVMVFEREFGDFVDIYR